MHIINPWHIVNPNQAALVVLGASEFDDPADNKSVFEEGKKLIVNYFSDPQRGFGLPDSKILDMFNSDLEKKDLLIEIDQFITRLVYTDSLSELFIYICSHGKHKKEFNHKLKIQLKGTKEKDAGKLEYNDKYDTYLDFESFINDIIRIANCRIYCILDCCYSGVVHNRSNSYFGEDFYRSSELKDPKKPPKAGVSIITSNNDKSSGTVIADDKLADVNAPLFSHELVMLLNEGDAYTNQNGFSIQELVPLVWRRIETLVGKSSDKQEQKEGKISLVTDDRYSALEPEYSERPYVRADSPDQQKNEDYDNYPISWWRIFQNNHINHYWYAENIRHKRTLMVQEDRIKPTMEKQRGEIERQRKEIERQRKEIERQRETIEVLKEIKDELRERKEELLRENEKGKRRHKEKAENAEEEVERLKGELKDVENHNAELGRTIEVLKERKEEGERGYVTQKEKAENAEVRVERLEGELESLQNHNTELKKEIEYASRDGELGVQDTHSASCILGCVHCSWCA